MGEFRGEELDAEYTRLCDTIKKLALDIVLDITWLERNSDKIDKSEMLPELDDAEGHLCKVRKLL